MRRVTRATVDCLSVTRWALRRGAKLCAVAAAVYGCGDGGDGAAPLSIRDSSGVRLVEHSAPQAAGVQEWQVPDEPVLVLGSAEGEQETQFFRIASARRASDGAIVVANTGTNEVRVFSPEGAVLGTFGRSGDGPGEFQALAGAWPLPDGSILTFDRRSGRLQVFTRGGDLVRTISLAGPDGSESLEGVLGDGSLVTFRTRSSAPGMQRHSRTKVLLHRSPSGELLDTIGSTEWLQILPRQVREGVVALITPLFSPVGQVGVGDDRIVLSDAQQPAVRVLGPSGRVVQIIRWLDQDRAVRPAHRRAFREERLGMAETEEQRVYVRKDLEGSEWAERFPALDGLLPGPDGGFWVKAYPRPGEGGSARWWVFNRHGILEREVHVPSGFWLEEIGEDYLLGIGLGELSVQQVRLYPREVHAGRE